MTFIQLLGGQQGVRSVIQRIRSTSVAGSSNNLVEETDEVGGIDISEEPLVVMEVRECFHKN